MDRREFLAKGGAAAAAMTLSQTGTGAQPQPAAPNIVFIMVDDLGYADLGCYGQQEIKTPHLDAMAEQGLRFSQCYSGCTVCAPARSVLMTGHHMGHTSVRGNTGGIPLLADDVTVAQVLKSAGYVCGGFGKWGLGDVRTTGVPEEHGFDVFYGYYHQVHAHGYYPAYLWRNSQKVMLQGNADDRREQYTHHLIFDEMLSFIRDNSDRSFFCYAPWTPPHGRYEIPEDEPAWQLYRDRPWPQDARVVAAMDTMIDRHVGELLATLAELEIDDRTIVFFCSDNGAANRFEGVFDSSGLLRGQKRDLYEGGIRVPMVVRWPGQITPGTTSDHPWYFADVMPTLAELAGAEAPEGIDGLSVVPTLLGEGAVGRPQEEHDFLYWEFARYNWQTGQYVPGGLAQAIRMGDWKAVRPQAEQPLELYSLSEDIGEEHDLAPQQPDIIARIESHLANCRAEPRPQQEPDRPEGARYR